MSEFRKRLTLAAVLVLAFAVSALTIGCPIKFFTGIPCPGCGMSRAVVSCLRFDFDAAFHFHPLFPLAPVVVAYIIFGDRLSRRVNTAVGVIIAAAFIAVYVYRIFFTTNPVTAIDFDSGFVVKSIKTIFSLSGG